VKEALATQRRAAELEPSNHNIKLNLAKLALKAGETALARDQLTELAQLGNAYPYQSEVAKLLASASK
jgi:Flp pilus assembly protein TadD